MSIETDLTDEEKELIRESRLECERKGTISLDAYVQKREHEA
jgi:hypothetical protein